MQILYTRGSSVATVSWHWDTDTDAYSINFIYLEKMDDFTISFLAKKVNIIFAKLKNHAIVFLDPLPYTKEIA